MLYVTGDIHGEAYDLMDRMEWLNGNGTPISDGDTVVCVGDVGLVYGSTEAESLKRLMASLPCDFIIMRGNHDTRYQRDLRKSGNWQPRPWHGTDSIVEDGIPNIIYLPDGPCRADIGGSGCLFLPGAYSVDGDYRKALGWPYEPEEQMDSAELAEAVRLSESGIDFVFSHTAPRKWDPFIDDLFLTGVKADRTMERAFDLILDEVEGSCRGWFFGHFHDDRKVGDFGRMLIYDIVAVPELS